MSLAWPDAVALVSLLVLLPVLSVLQLRLLRGVEVERMPAYLSSAVGLLVLGGAAWALGSRDGGSSAVGLVPLPWEAFALWSGTLVGAGLALTAGFRWMGMILGLREAPLLRSLLPRTASERAAFTGLSVAAGVGEELTYRGYVIPVLAGLLGPAGAAAVSSVVFGVLHAYQGPLGMARTAALGGLLAWGFLASGSLLPPIAAHALLDVVLGAALAERMMVPDGPSGVGNTEDTPATR